MDEALLQFGPFSLRIHGTLFRHAELVPLSPKELALLRVLVSNPGRIVPLAVLRRSAWNGIHVSDESLPRCISSLRARLGVKNSIQTIYKRGYRLMLPVGRVVVGATDGQPAEVVQLVHGERRRMRAVTPMKLAVLPFQTLHGVPPVLGQGIAEAILLRMVPRLHPALKLLALDSVLHHVNHGLAAREVGVALNADAVLTGTVAALARNLRVRAEMIQVSDHTQLWLEDFLIPCDAGQSIENQAAERIEAAILGRLWPSVWDENMGNEVVDTGMSAGIGNPDNPAARELLASGRHHLSGA